MAVKYRKGMIPKIRRNIDNLRKEFPPEEYPAVVDVGCMEGYSVDYFNKCGYKAFGIDIDCNYRREGIVCGNFLEMDINGNQDLIFSRHSLEHIELENNKGTYRFFDKCLEILRPGGIIYLIVPVSQWFEFYVGHKPDDVEHAFRLLWSVLVTFPFVVEKERCRENALIIARKL